jgi:hypothetical protein
MPTRPKGWKRESARHSLAARGVKTRLMPRRYQKWIETHRPEQLGMMSISNIIKYGKFKGYLPGDDRYSQYEEYEFGGETFIIGRDPQAANYELIAEIPGSKKKSKTNNKQMYELRVYTIKGDNPEWSKWKKFSSAQEAVDEGWKVIDKGKGRYRNEIVPVKSYSKKEAAVMRHLGYDHPNINEKQLAKLRRQVMRSYS